MKLRIITAAVAATAAVGLAAVPAQAADPTDVTVTGGSLSITSVTVSDFAGITLNGAAQTTTASVNDFSVTDATGSGAGWNVTIQGTQFQEWDASLNAGAGDYVSGGKTLPVNSMDIAALDVTANGTSSPAPTTSARSGVDNTTGAVKIATAAIGEGMGQFDFTGANKLSLSIPATTYAKTYRSNVTVSVVSGP